MKTYFGKEKLALLSSITNTAKGNSIYRHIYMDKNSIAVTDEVVLIHFKYGEESLKKPCLVINPKYKDDIEKEDFIDNTVGNIPINYSDAIKYPKWKNIFENYKEKRDDIEADNGLEFFYLIGAKYNIIFDYIAKYRFFKNLKNIKLSYYQYKGYNEPLFVSNSDDTIEIAIMPYILENEQKKIEENSKA